MKYNMIYYIYASKAKNNIVPSKCVNSTKHLPKKQKGVLWYFLVAQRL